MKKIELSEHFTYKKLLLYSLPVMLTTIASMSFMMVDGYFVSNFLGVDALAAVDLVSPVYFAVYSIGIMLGAGGSALIAKHKGESDVDAARKCFTMLVALAVLFGIIIAPIIIFFMDDLLRLQGADDSILPFCEEYGVLLFLFLPVHLVDSAFESLWVALEKVKFGFVLSMVAGTTNVFLDWLFMGRFSMGLKGAALATCIAAVLGTVVSVTYFSIRSENRLYFVRFGIKLSDIWEVCFNGASEMIDTVAENLTMLVLNGRILTLIGSTGVAVMGIYNYVMCVFLAIFYGLGSTAITVVGYKKGQGDESEIRGVLKKGIVLNIFLGIMSFLVCILFSRSIAELYVGYEKTLVPYAARVLMISSISCLFYGFVMYVSAYFTGMEDGLSSIIIAVMLSLIAPISAAYVLPSVFGAIAIWLSIPMGTMICAILCVILLKVRKSSCLCKEFRMTEYDNE